MTKEDDKDIAKLQLQLQIEQAKARGEEARLKVAETNLESELLKGMDSKQKLGKAAMDNIGGLGKDIGGLGKNIVEVWKDVESDNKENSNSGNANNTAVESNR